MDDGTARRTRVGRAVAASTVGTAIEWYDFFVYGVAAAVVLNRLFFPEADPAAGTLASFAVFGVGFLFRPVGGLFFANLGDRLGRRPVLIMTLLLMGVSTTLIGLLPTYGEIGLWAPALLVVLRAMQGMGAGAELGGAALMASEHAPERRGFYASFPAAGLSVGILLSLLAFTAVSALPEDQFLAWGWRVPFLASILVLGVGLFIRARVSETPDFVEVKEAGNEARVPVVAVVRDSPKNLLLAMGATFASHGYGFVVQVFLLSYVTTQLGLPRSTALTAAVIANAAGILSLPAFGALSDLVGRRAVIMGGAMFGLLFAFPLFWMLDTGDTLLVWLAFTLGIAVCVNSMFAPQGAYFTELFDPRVRYSGFVAAREMSAVLVAGPAPLVAAALLAWTDGDPWSISAYLALLSLITLVAAYLAPETLRKEATQRESKDRGNV